MVLLTLARRAGASWCDYLGRVLATGLLLATAVILLAAVAPAAYWVGQHVDQVLAPARRLRDRPTVVRLEHRYARQLRFLTNRLRPDRPAGLALTVGLGVVALLAAALSEVTEDVVTGDELVRVDNPVSRYVIAHRQPWLTTSMGIITHLGSTAVLVPMLLAVGLAVRRHRRTWAPMVFLFVTWGGATLTSTVIKLLVARSRPASEALVQALGYAFPSGHSTAATAGWLAVAVVLAGLARSMTVRASVLAAALVIALLVGISRVYLGVHAPTDVLAGWALGGLWVTGALTLTHLLTSRSDDPPGGT